MAESALNAVLTETDDFLTDLLGRASIVHKCEDRQLRSTLALLAFNAGQLRARLSPVREAIAQAQTADRPHPPKGAWRPWGFMPAQPNLNAANDQSTVPPSRPE